MKVVDVESSLEPSGRGGVGDRVGGGSCDEGSHYEGSSASTDSTFDSDDTPSSPKRPPPSREIPR